MDDRVATALCVLGPLEVVRDGEPVRLGSAQQRRLLAVLVVHANEVVSSDRLIDVCGVTSRRRARRTRSRHWCHGCARRSVTTASRHAHRGIGCGWRPSRWTRCVSRSWCGSGSGRLNSRRSRSGAFDEALGLWRGSPYAEFASEEFAAAEVARLVELRARAIEERSAALLELGPPGGRHRRTRGRDRGRAVSRAAAGAVDARARPRRDGRSSRCAPTTSFVGSWPTRSVWCPHPGCRSSTTTSCGNTPTSHGPDHPPRTAADLPSGTVTFLFTEVEGSTRLWDEHPDVMHARDGASRRAAARRGRVTRWLHRQDDGRWVPRRVRDRPRCGRRCGCRTTVAPRGRLEHRGDRARPDGDPYR